MKLLLAIFASIILVFITSFATVGQVNYASIDSLRMHSSGEKMIIYYGIQVEDESSFFEVELKVVMDGKRVIVNSLTGDFGGQITPGLKKMMRWEWKKDFQGNIERAEIDVVAKLIPGPSAGFEVVSDITYAPAEVSFRNISRNADMYSWDFGDPDSGVENKSLEDSPSHIFNKPGRYRVVLSASSKIYKKFDDAEIIITIAMMPDPPLAGFEIDNGGEYFEVPATIVFENTSSKADEYFWDFGDPQSHDENNSSEENPSHTYLKPGSYNVELRSTNSETGLDDTHTNTITLKVAGVKPVANFEYSPTKIIKAPVTIWFKNTSEKGNKYLWDFDDPESGKKSFSKSKSTVPHLFEKSNTYNVKLRVTNTGSGKSDVKTISIIIPESK